VLEHFNFSTYKEIIIRWVQKQKDFVELKVFFGDMCNKDQFLFVAFLSGRQKILAKTHILLIVLRSMIVFLFARQ